MLARNLLTKTYCLIKSDHYDATVNPRSLLIPFSLGESDTQSEIYFSLPLNFPLIEHSKFLMW